MAKQQKKYINKTLAGKGSNESLANTRKINASTQYEECSEHLSPFGGLLAVVKFLDLIEFKKIFSSAYIKPQRRPLLGNYYMFNGILMLIFIGFNRIWHFTYIRLDTLICGMMNVKKLPVVTTFWRYLDSLGINQALSLLRIMAIIRERVWQLCGISLQKIRIDADTTVETIFGNQQGARKGHNTKYRGKKGYRPVLAFIEDTSEYLYGKLRKGTTISGKEAANMVKQIKAQLPGCVKEVLFRADAEFLSWECIKALLSNGFEFIISNKGCKPQFDDKGWYRPHKRNNAMFNDCLHKPGGW